MERAPVLRLFRCRPRHTAFDRILRDVLIPDLIAIPEVIAVHAGRQGPDETGERLVASIWSSGVEMTSAMGDDVEQSAFHPEHLVETTDRRVEVHRLAYAERFAPDPPMLMRVARGTTRPGQLSAYERQVEHGVAADVAAGHGPVAVYFSTLPPVAFVTFSLWRQWTDLAETTGTGASTPVSTRYSDHLEAFDAEHFEILPNIERSAASPGRITDSR